MLPITVSPEPIGIQTDGPPKIVKIDSTKPDLSYGVGEEIFIDVTFTSPVDVTGTPTLRMETGCKSAPCRVKEVQSFTCLADEGKFSLTFRKLSSDDDYQKQHILNIPTTADQEYLKQVLEQLDGVNKVTVFYDDTDDRDYSFGRRVCTSKGNLVRITFDDVDSTVGIDGDIPELTFDPINSPLDPRTYENLGDGSFLRAQLSGNTVSLSSTAIEVTKGVNYSDRYATYVSGSGTSTVKFKYTVQVGDSSSDLEALSIHTTSSSSIFKAGSTKIHADTTNVPTNNERYRYISARGSSLSFNRAISIDTSTPTVLKVQPTTYTTPNTYGVGEVIYLSAVFSHNVTVYHPTVVPTISDLRPYLTLETGSQNRRAMYESCTDGNTVNFKYIVQTGDLTADLDYASTSALTIPGGSYIRRSSTTPTTDIDPTLPFPADTNSLADKGSLAIDTSTPKIDRVTASTSLNPSDYLTGGTVLSAGDEVYIEAKYNFPVTVVGEPRMYVYTGATTPVAQETIVAVPENFDYEYDSKLVKTGATLGINLQFSLVNTLSVTETVELHLPGFGVSVPDIANITMVARHPLTYKQLPISGSWDSTNKKIILTAKSHVTSTLAPLTPPDALFPSGISILVNIAPSNGLTAPSIGVREGTTGEAGIYLTTGSAAGSVAAPPTYYPYPNVNIGIGIASASINSFTPAVAGGATRMVLNFTNVNALTTASSAAVTVELPDFTSDTSLGALQVTSLAKPLAFSITASFTNTPTLTLTATANIDAMTPHVLQIQGLGLPAAGVSPNTASSIKIGINQNDEVTSLIHTVPSVGLMSNFLFTYGSAPVLDSSVPLYITGTLTSGGLNVGDTLVLETSSSVTTTSGAQVTLAVYDNDSASSVSTIWSGTFDPTTETFTFTVLSVLSAPSVSVSIYVPSSSNVKLPSTPIVASTSADNVKLTVNSVLSAIAQYTLPVNQRPAVGAYIEDYPIMEYWPKYLGSSIDYFFNFTCKFSNDLDGDDFIYFILPNFGGSAFADQIANSTALATSAGALQHNATDSYRLWWKQSETVTSGGVTYTCDSAATPCLKVKVTNRIAARTEFTIPVNKALGMSLPNLGVPNAPSLHGIKSFAKITSGNVEAAVSVNNGDCSGFCHLGISYGASYSNTASKIALVFQISRPISKGNEFEVTLPGFTGANVDSLALTTIRGGSNIFKGFWTLSNTKVNLIAVANIAAFTMIEIEVDTGQIALPNLDLTGVCATDGITMMTNATVYETASSRASSTSLTGTFHTCEARMRPVAFSSSSIVLNPAVPNEETDLTLTFTLADLALTTSDQIVVEVPHKLTWAQGVKTNVTLTGSHAASFTGVMDTTLSTKSTITLTPTSGINSNTAITVTLPAAKNHIIVPPGGIYDDPSTFLINVVTSNRYHAHGPFSFTSSTVVSAVANTEITSYTVNDFAGTQLLGGAVGTYINSIELGFELSNTALTANSDVFIKLPGFTYSVGTNPVVTCVDSTCYPMDGSWDTVTSKLRLRSQGSIGYNVGQMKYRVAFASPGILPPTSGLPPNSEDIKISLTMSGSSYPDLAETPILSSPCIGICSVHVGYDVAREGQVAQFNLDISTVNPLSSGDELNMNLTQIVQGPWDGSVALTGTHAAYFTGKFTGTAMTSSNGELGTGVFVLKCTASLPTRDIKISLARSNALKIFPLGVYNSGFKFDVNASDATNTSTIGPVTTTQVPTSVQPVGRVLFSKITYDVDYVSHYTDLRENFAGSPSLAGQPTAIQVVCAFSSDLKMGEQIQLHLPEFTSSLTTLDVKDNLDSRHFGNLVDDSEHFTASWNAASSTITFTLKYYPSSDIIVSDYRRPALTRETTINITVSDGQVNLPTSGLTTNSSNIYLSTNAVDGPVASTAIEDSPAIGAVLFSQLSWYRGANATKGGQLHQDSIGDFVSPGDEVGIKFVLTLNEKLAQSDVLYLKLPGFTSSADIASVAMDTYRSDASTFFKGHESTTEWSASWDLSEELLSLTCIKVGGCDSTLSHPITFDVKESNNIKTPTNGFLAGVPNDLSKRFYLYSRSFIVPIQPTTITDVQGVGFDNIQVTLLPNPYLASGEVTILDFSLKLAPNMVLYHGDNVTCSLTGFVRDDSTYERVPLLIDPTNSFNLAWFDDTVDKLTVRLNGTLSHGTTARFRIGGLKVPAGGIDDAQSKLFSCGAKASETYHQSLSSNTFDFTTPVSTFSTVGHMHSSSLSFSQRIAGQDTTMTFVVNINSVVAIGEDFLLELPNFSLSSSTSLAVTSSGFTVTTSTSAGGFFALRLTATEAVTSQNTPITIVITGVKLPVKGVEEDSLSITFKSETVRGVISKPMPVATTNGVNTFQNQQVSFIPAESTTAITVGGDKRRFKLLDTDRLFNPLAYVNKTVLIGGEHFFVEKIEGDTLIASTPWSGANVLASTPSTYLYYPGYRPAPYYSGSTTDSIIFKYIVQEGDVSSDLRMHNVSDVDLWQGANIKRTSTTPTTVASTTLPKVFSSYSLYANSEIKVDTSQPYVLQVNSTKRDGNYGIVGEEIDIVVTFSAPVSVYRPETVSINVPAIELNVDSSDNVPRYAYFASGNNTAKLTFVYTIQEGDNVDDLSYKHHKKDLYSTGTVDGLSAITTILGANKGYIYTKATNLVQLANVSLPNPGFGRSIGYKKNINVNTTVSSNRHGMDDPWMSGKFARVVSVSSITGNGRYAAGHMIDLLVTFNENVTVDTRGGRPYIAMEVGTGNTLRKAEYVDYKTDTNYFNHSLVFRYTVQAGDTSSDLNYKCTCLDFCMTTYIEKNGGRIINDFKNEIDYTLPSPSVSTNEHLAKSRDIIVDTAPATILSMSSNKLDGTYGVGESIEIILTFSNTVAVSGYPRLSVGTENGCHAYYKSGNGTSVLIFEYLVESKDSYSMSDLSHSGRISSLDPNGGWIRSASHNPITDATLSLPITGQPKSLGYSKDIVIDTTPATVKGVSITKETSSGSKMSFLPPYQTIDVEVINMNVTYGMWKIKYNNLETGCVQWNATGETVKNALKATNLLDVHVYHIDYVNDLGHSPPYFRRYMVEFLVPYTGVSEISVVTDGCEAFGCHNKTYKGDCPTVNKPVITVNRDIKVYSGVFDVKMQFSHRVHTSGTPFLTFETGNHDAVARYAPAATQYFDIGVHGSSKLSNGQFQLSYGKYKTDCIEFDAAMTVARGSVKNRLLEIPQVAAIGVKSVFKEERGNGYRYTVNFYPSAVLKQLEAVEYTSTGNGVCRPLVPSDAKVQIPSTEDLTFRYVMTRGSRLVLKAKSQVNKNVAKAITVPSSYGITTPRDGLSNDVDLAYKQLGFSSLNSNFNMLQIAKFDTITTEMGSFRRTSISFSPNKMDTNVAIMGSFAYSGDIEIGENVLFKLPGFNCSCIPNAANRGCTFHNRASVNVHGGPVLDADIAAKFTVTYRHYTSELNFQAKQKILAGEQIVFTLPAKANFTSPKTAIHANSKTFLISTDAAHGVVTDFPIQNAEGIGISSSQVILLNPRPGQQSDIVFIFAPTDKIDTGTTLTWAFTGVLPDSTCANQNNIAMSWAPIDYADNDLGPLTIGYDNDYFSASPVTMSYDGAGVGTITVKTNRVLYPRDHIIRISGSTDICAFTVPKNGFYKATNPIFITLNPKDLKFQHQYSNVSATEIEIYPDPIGGLDMTASSVSFSNPIASETSAFTFVLKPTMRLNRHDTLVFTMPESEGITVPKGSCDISGISAASFDCDYDDSSGALTLTAKDDLPIATYTVTVEATNMIRIPDSGFMPQVMNDVTFTCNSANGQIVPTPVKDIFGSNWPTVNAHFEAKIITSAKKVTEPTDIYFEFASRVKIVSGDHIAVHLPGFTCPQVNNTLKSLESTFSTMNATWAPTSERLVLHIKEIDFPDTNIMQINNQKTYYYWNTKILAANNCKVPPSGFYMNTNSFKYWVYNSGGPNGINSLPQWTEFTATSGVGFLSSRMSFSPGVVSTSVFNQIKLIFSLSQKLLAKEEITILLPGFSSTESVIALSGPDATKYTARWESASTKLILTPMTTIVPVIQTIYVGVENKFLLPTAGVVRDDASYKMSLESIASTQIYSEMGPITNYPIRFTQPVGNFLQSAVVFSDMRAGEVSDVEITFQLTGEIAIGEEVVLKLTTVENLVDLTQPMGVIDMGTNLPSTDWLGKYNAASNTITLRAKSVISASTVVQVKANTANQLIVPRNGTNLNDPSWVISTDAVSAPVLTPVSIKSSPAIGAIIDSKLIFPGTDVGGNMKLDMAMTTSKGLVVGDTIDIFLNNFRSTMDVTSFTMASTHASSFTAAYTHNTKTLRLTVTQDVPTFFSIGVQTVTSIQFPEFSIQDGTSSGITAIITSTVCPVPTAIALNVHSGIGFRAASLSYTSMPVAAGGTTGVALTLKLSGVLKYGEKIYLQLKGFTAASATVSSAVVTSTTGHTFSGSIANSNNVTLTYSGDTVGGGTEIQVEITSVNGLRIPAAGLKANDPGLLIWTDASDVGYNGFYLPAGGNQGGNEVNVLSVPLSPGVGSFSSTSVTYTNSGGGSTLVPGGVVAVNVQFTSTVALVAGDAVFLKLDGFGGDDVDDVDLHSSDASNFDAVWTECTGTLTLVAKMSIAAGAHDINVLASNNIKLPDQGVALNDARIQISSNATAGNVAMVSVASSTAVGSLLRSSLEFEPALGSVSSTYQTVDSPVDLVLKFALSGNVAAGEYIKLKLTGWKIELASTDVAEISVGSKRYTTLGYDSTTAGNTFTTHSLDATNHVLLSLGYTGQSLPGTIANSNNPSFMAYFDMSTEDLVLIALETIYAQHDMSIYISDKNALYMPIEGQQENAAGLSLSTNAAAAPITEQRIEYVEGVGVFYSEIAFAPSVNGQLSEITFSINTTCPLQANDYIKLNLTDFGGTSTAADAVVLKGHDGSRKFQAAWVATWDDETATTPLKDSMTIKATETISSDNVNSVIISSANGLTLPPSGILEDVGVTFYVVAQCLGTVKKRVTDVHTVVGAVTSSTLALGSPTPEQPSSIDIGFTLEDDMDAGDELIVHLEGFEYDGIGDDGYGTLALTGTDAAEFDAVWTNGDLNTVGTELKFPSLTPISTENAKDKIYRAADPNPIQEADLTMPSLTMLGTSSVAIDTRTPPVIVDVYTLSGKGAPHPHGNLLEFQVKFTAPVLITVDSYKIVDTWVGYEPFLTIQIGKLLRNCLYKSGNNTDTLVFSHIVESGDKDTNIAIASSHSLNSNGCSILSSSGITMANLTIPEPLNYLAREDDRITPAKLSVDALEKISVVKVSTKKADGTYLAGEIIDIDVEFDGEVAVSGNPYLMLRSGFKAPPGTPNNATALFVDGSRTQTLEVGFNSKSQIYSGGFILTYGAGVGAYKIRTGCIDWDTAEGSTDGLKERLLEIPEIVDAGGITSVVKTATDVGNSYVITFNFDHASTLYYDAVESQIFCEMPFNKDGDYVGGYNFVVSPPTKMLTFRYTVQHNDHDWDLEYQGHDALVLPNSASVFVRTRSTRSYTDAAIVLPQSGTANSLSGGHNLVINGTTPSILRVTAAAGTYGYGQWIDITVKYDLNVKVVGTPKLKLNVNYVTSYATYLSGSTTQDLIFRYVIGKTDVTQNMNYTTVDDLILSTGANDGIFAYSTLSNLPASLKLPHPKSPYSLGASAVSIVDLQYPAQVMKVYTDIANGYYSPGDVIPIFVQFTRPVTMQRTAALAAEGYPSLKIATGLGYTTNRANATYVSGSGTDTFRFEYTIGLNDTTIDLNAVDGIQLRDEIGADAVRPWHPFVKMIDVNGKNASVAFDQWTIMMKDAHQVVIDQTTPSVGNIYFVTADGLYGPGDHIFIKVEFNRKVAVIGYPTLKLTIFDRTDLQVASYVNGTGTTTLLFDYLIPGSDISKGQLAPFTNDLDYSGVLALENHLNGSQILLHSMNPVKPANLRLPEVHESGLRVPHEIRINGNTPEVIQMTSDTPDGTYGVGEIIDIKMVFNVAVMINGTGTILLETGVDDAYANYHSGNNTDTLIFRYIVQAGHKSDDLDVFDTSTPPFNLDFKASLAFVVNDLQPDQMTPNPSPGKQAVTIKRAGNDPSIAANYALPLPGTPNSLSVQKNIKIFTDPPTVTKIWTTHRNATYGIGENIPIYVDFGNPVSVMGTPVLEMATYNTDCIGDRCNDAVYASGSGTSTLLFIYTVKFGDKTTALDYQNEGSLKVHATWSDMVDQGQQYIKMYSTNPVTDADLTLPPPGKKLTVISPSSLVGSYHKLDIQTMGLAVADVSCSLTSGLYTFGQELDILVQMTGVVVVRGLPYIQLDLLSEGKAYYTSGSGTSLLKFSYVATSSDNTLDLSYKDEFSFELDGGSVVSIVDFSMNAVQTLPNPGEKGSLSFNKDIILTGDRPFITDVYVDGGYCSMDGTSSGIRWGVGQRIDVVLEFDQQVQVVNGGVPRLRMNTGGVGKYVRGSGTYKIVFEYVVEEADTNVALLDLTDSLPFIDQSGGELVSMSDIIVVKADIESVPSTGQPGSLAWNCGIEVSKDQTKVVKAEFLQKDGTYVSGNELSIKVTFDNAVKANGNVTLELYTGEDTMPGIAKYLSGGDGTQDYIIFKYVVTALDVSSDLDYISRYSIKMDESVMDSVGNRQNFIKRGATLPTQYVDLALPARGNTNSLGMSGNIVLDDAAPRVTSTKVDHNDGEYTTGEKFVFTVEFDKTVFVKAGAESSLVLYLNSDSHSDPAASAAKYIAGSGSQSLQFEYTMAANDEVNKLDYVCTGFCISGSQDGVYSPRPLDAPGACDVYTVVGGFNVCASLVMPVRNDGLSNLEGKNIVISREVPKLTKMEFVTPFSSWAYGVGQEIEISAQFTKPIFLPAGGGEMKVILNTEMDFMGRVIGWGAAKFKSYSGDKVFFKYVVEAGDNVEFLDVANSTSMTGVLLRYSNSVPSIVCNLTMEEPRTVNSLSFHRRISLNTAVPVIEHLIPVKRPGTYVEGEKIAIICRYNLPVNVTGSPRLKLNVNGGSAYALYDGNWKEEDTNFDILDTDVVFVYTVASGDGNADVLMHNGAGSLELNGGRIRMKSTIPTIDASLVVRDQTDHDRRYGHVNGQWKAFYPKKVEVLMRDLWHESAGDLDVKLEHGGETASVFTKVGLKEGQGYYTGRQPFESTFGEGQPHYASFMASGSYGTSEVHKSRHLGGLGYDYLFGDMNPENLALKGTAKQSTTKYKSHAGLAIDGNVDGFASRGSVSHTGGHGEEDWNPWWQVRLESEVKIGGIRVWNRQLQQARDEIQVINVVAPGKNPQGTYRMRIDYGGKNYTSKVDLPVDAAATGSLETMSGALEAMLGRLGSVDVTRTSTTNLLGGYQGYQYTVTFKGHPGDVPKIGIHYTNFTLTPDAKVMVETLRQGVDNPKYNYKLDSNEKEYVDNLYPCWIFIFDSTVPQPELIEDFYELKKKAVWMQEVAQGGRVINLSPGGITGQTVRVMLNNTNYLSLAEVQVYEANIESMSQYSGGSPIQERPIVQPYIAEDSLDDTWKNVQFGGLWHLTITDTKKYNSDRDIGQIREHNGMGKINDWVLMITDMAGVIHRFYVDYHVEVLTLPKYGELYFQELNDKDEGYSLFNGRTFSKLEEAPGMGRFLAPCYGVDTTGLNGVESVGNHRFCPLNYGVGGLRSWQKTGAKPVVNLHGKERVVVYKPFADFLGQDHFTYRTLFGTVPGETTEVRVNVKNCRIYEKEETKGTSSTVHSLCSCKRTEQLLFGDPTNCEAAIISTCGASATSEEVYPFMCRMCKGAHSTFTSACRSEIEKAVAWLDDKGLCSADVPAGGYPVCKEEGTAALTREPFMLYGVGEDYYRGGRGMTKVQMQSNKVN
eukprot:CAMPEP_0118646096 /NCGR_PEP_ID=MMETSP0785-20121206/7860_1 /TAXON_ID=91992 /ORGANISM="Bolidomonas pacifica, Strain CCMP 1866" /LENGTH=7824 /DNA_ID=CAMNT_0006538039 /DNA_START=267 /DNA_END=23742 /DNA_ORIENTATION=+